MNPSIARPVAALLSLLLAADPAVGAPTSVWSERGNGDGRPAPAQLASIGGLLPQPGRLLPALGPASPPNDSVSRGRPRETGEPQNRLSRLLAAVPPQAMSVQESFLGRRPNEATLLLQDLHLNEEAQLRLAETLQALAATDAVDVIGVEGA